MWMWHIPDICICHVIGQHCFLWMTLLCVDQSEAYFRHAYAWMCVSLEKLVIGPSGFQTHDITSRSHKITSVTLVYHQRGVERYNFKLKNLQNAAEKSWMKNTTMIFIDKLQKHIKNKKYMILVEWDFKQSAPSIKKVFSVYNGDPMYKYLFLSWWCAVLCSVLCVSCLGTESVKTNIP